MTKKSPNRYIKKHRAIIYTCGNNNLNSALNSFEYKHFPEANRTFHFKVFSLKQ